MLRVIFENPSKGRKPSNKGNKGLANRWQNH